MTPKPVPPISEERLLKAVERRKESVSGDVGWHINSEKDAHDFALYILKAKEVLRKHEVHLRLGREGRCVECNQPKNKGCAPDCAIAELLKEGKEPNP